jgi:hypothetical protein
MLLLGLFLERAALSQVHQTSQPTSSRIHALLGMGKLNGRGFVEYDYGAVESRCKTAVGPLHTCMKMNMLRGRRATGQTKAGLTDGCHAGDDHPPHWRTGRVLLSSTQSFAELRLEEWK